MFEIKEVTTKPVKLFGQEFNLPKPPLRVVTQFQKRVREDLNEKRGDIFDIYIEFLLKAGLPVEVIDQLELEQADELVTYLIGAKKN